MSDWIRNDTTGKIDLNGRKIDEIIRKLMNRVKCLTQEKNKMQKELKLLKDTFSQISMNVKTEATSDDKGNNYVDDDDDDDLVTDGSSTFFCQKEKKRSTSFAEELPEKMKIMGLTSMCPIDHSACCSKELSLKLVEQNQILQKTIKDILCLNGSSLEEYLKFSYSRERMLAKDCEIKSLKEKIENLEMRLANDPRNKTSKQFVNTRTTDESKDRTFEEILQRSVSSSLAFQSNDLKKQNVCKSNSRSFDDYLEFENHAGNHADVTL